jgi:hypothetical protein
MVRPPLECENFIFLGFMAQPAAVIRGEATCAEKLKGLGFQPRERNTGVAA